MMIDTNLNKPLIEKLARKNILVVDDEGIITKTLCDLLKKAGFYADASGDGFDAIEKAEETGFDLIIADIRMPEIDGVQTIRKIRESSRIKNKPDAPVIFITGFPDSFAASEAREFGEVVTKPFDMKEFLSVVEKYIQ